MIETRRLPGQISVEKERVCESKREKERERERPRETERDTETEVEGRIKKETELQREETKLQREERRSQSGKKGGCIKRLTLTEGCSDCQGHRNWPHLRPPSPVCPASLR